MLKSRSILTFRDECLLPQLTPLRKSFGQKQSVNKLRHNIMTSIQYGNVPMTCLMLNCLRGNQNPTGCVRACMRACVRACARARACVCVGGGWGGCMEMSYFCGSVDHGEQGNCGQYP